MKRKLLFLLAALLTSVGMWADVVPTASAPVAGNNYYIYNPATKKFLVKSSSSNDDGYLPYVQLEGHAWTIEASDKDGYVKMRTKDGTNEYFWGKYWAAIGGRYNVYPDENYFKIQKVADTDNDYKLHSFGWEGTDNAFVYINSENGWRVACNSQGQGSLDARYTVWQFVTEADYAAYMLEKYGEDVSSKVTNTTFDENKNGWTADPGFTNDQIASNQGGAFNVPFWENWKSNTEGQGKANKMYQNISNIDNGLYTLVMAASVNFLDTDHQYIFANDDKTYLTTTTPTYYEVQTLVKSKSISIGLEQTSTTAGWMAMDNVRLYYLGNDISYYSPEEFESGTQADAGAWKYYDVNAGWYKIASNAAITLYYTQDDSDDADNTESVSISQNGYTYLKLSEGGQLYFKSSANATLTLTEGFVANDDITKFFLTNPNFTGNADGWEGNPSYQSNNAEKFNTTFDVYQTASALPAGYYWIKAQAFDRQTDQEATYESATSVSKAYLYAGNASTLVKRIYDDASTSQKNGGTYEKSFTKDETTVYIPDRPVAGEKYFDAGLYDNELLIYHNGGDLRIGIKKYVATSNDWCLFDNFRLIYAGSTPSNGTDMTSLITNPSFETNSTTGWSTNAGFYIQNGSDLINKIGTYYGMLQGKTTHRNANQTVSSPVPAGKYILSVNAKANSDAGNVSLNIGDNSTPIPSGVDASVYTVAYETAESSSPQIKFAASNGEGDLRRCYLDNFTLTYYETLPDVSISDLTSQAMASDVRAALTSASTTYSSSKTAANYNALQTAIVYAKVSIAEYAAKTGTDADWTGIIANPSFETGTPNYYKGWTVDVSSGSSTSDEQHRYKEGGMGSKDAGSWRFFIWTSDAGAATIKQTVSELPAGNYKLSAYMASESGDVFTLTAGSTSSKVMASDGNATLVEVYFTQATQGNIEISARHSNSWFDLDNFHLTCDPTLPESISGVDGDMNAAIRSAQTTAVNTYNSSNTFANMLSAQTAIKNAVESIQMYKEIATIRDNYQAKADELDAAGQAAYTAAINVASIGALTQYTEGAYASISDAETAFHNDYVTAVKAQTTANTDMTEAITNPSFDTKNANGWKITETSHGNQQYGSLTAESWNNNSVKYSQDITSLHSGVYMLTAQVDNGRNNNNVSLFAKIGETTESTLAPYRAISSYASTSSDLIADVSLCYTSVIFNVASDNTTATIGVNDVSTGDGWMIFDNFHLIYVGESLPASIESLTGIMNKDVKDAANAAIETYNSENTIANYKAAQAAITRAEVSEAEYAKVSSSDRSAYRNRMGELLTKTNVYTTAAYNKWYANVEDNYTNGVYTDAEVVTLTAAGACQGATETSHKKANRIDDVLLSSWTIGGEPCSDYNKNLYINTWSVEGNSDGSGFQTPFFEYWTSDGNSLGEATMVGTVTGLEASTEYSVDIWARVRQTNNQEKAAEKIMLQVGSGAPVDLAAGTQHTTHGTSDFYNGHFTAVGSTDESGDLTITISVAAGSNVSWLSFKDVAYNRQNVSGSVKTYSGVYNDNETIAPTAEAPIVDISGATFNGTLTASYASNANGFIIATAAQKAAMGNPKNVIVGNTCDNLVITDGVDITIPAALTKATSATYSRSIAESSNFGTICLPYDVESDDYIQYYTASAISGDVLKLETVDDVPAGTPAIFKKKTENATSITVTSSNADVSNDAREEGATVKLVGTFEEITIDGKGETPAAEDCYYIKSNQFWQGNENFIIGAFRAYLTTGSASARLTIQIDEETAVNTLKELDANQELKDGKYLINGRIVIVKDGQSFYVDGKLK